MDPPAICFEKRKISQSHWSIINDEGHEDKTMKVDLKTIEAKKEDRVEDLEKYITENCDYVYTFFMIADDETAENDTFIIVNRETMLTFRCEILALFTVDAANLRLCNMDFEDFSDNCEEGEIFRDFMNRDELRDMIKANIIN